MEELVNKCLNSWGYWAHLFVFICIGITSFLWVIYIRRTTQGKALSSGIADFFLYLIGGSVVIGYTRRPALLLTGAVSAFVFTTLTIKLDRKKNQSNKKPE